MLEKCKAHLEAEKPLRELELTPEERKPIGGFLFLSQRPMLYVLNLGDDEAAELDTAVERHKLGALKGGRIRRWWRFAGGLRRNWRRWTRRKRRSCCLLMD